METATNKTITVETMVKAPIEKVWKFWTEPEHIAQWAFASDDWHAPHAENDLRTGGKFKTTMAAKDGSFSFDFEGVYTDVKKHSVIEYEIADGRKVKITFSSEDGGTKVVETFEAEGTHSIEQQLTGWQAIMNNFKKHTEGN
ncbi:SRPBCC family protein [Mucilaginibacter sp. BJC16-A38]|uniref:SRPBCC family protein n=1 Tax=Mucilaginibacter phenanthrenivorans TaxID=1234842 RepID=UPI00215808A5|nr:SRPBCC family protein [Mucilaginibacter phenanthrenivorans]MCR8559404.1 SRPBCC family protein [Mucilaginibacter phenanthrenivorans]